MGGGGGFRARRPSLCGVPTGEGSAAEEKQIAKFENIKFSVKKNGHLNWILMRSTGYLIIRFEMNNVRIRSSFKLTYHSVTIQRDRLR